MENYLEYHLKKYPKSEIQDFIKLIYQATFGTGHMIDSPAKSLTRLKEEISALESVSFSEDLYDYISDDYVRINLRVYKHYNLNVNLLNESFTNTSNMFVDNDKIFTEELNKLRTFLINNGFDSEKVERNFLDYSTKDYPAVHHTKSYRDEYKPAYRVIHQNFLSEEIQYYQVRHFLENFDESKVNFFAIEGKAGSGKSTLASLLEKDNDVTIIHIDDFFDDANSQIGVNSLRIVKEVINPAVIGKPLKYRKFNCTTKTFSEVKIDCLNPFIIIEGAYSANPVLEEYYKGIIYLNVNEETQHNRLIRRSKHLYPKFVNEWLPRENKYFLNYNIFRKSDIIV